MEQKRILSVQDISCLGKCANTVALPVLSAMGHECVILPTALLSTHTGGFTDYTFLDLTGEMKRIIGHWRKIRLKFDGLLTGYFGSVEQLDIVAEYVAPDQQGIFRFVDPVIGDNGTLYSIYDESFASHMRKFCVGADVVTPNLTEAALVTGLPFRGNHFDEAWIREIIAAFRELGVKKTVLTGVRYGDDRIGLFAVDNETGEEGRFSTPYVDAYLPGTGDVLASSLCAYMMAREPFLAAAEKALDFTYASIQDTIGSNKLYGLNFEPHLRSL